MTESKTPRRAAVIELLGSFDRALHTSEIATRLDVVPSMIGALSRVLDDLVFDGTVTALPGHRFRLAAAERPAERERTPRSTRSTRDRGFQDERPRRRQERTEGFFSAHARGFGFVHREGNSEDVFIPNEAIGGAIHGDKVAVQIVMRTARGVEGAVVEVLERRAARISGTLRRRGSGTWIEPDDGRIRGPIVLKPSKAADGSVIPIPGEDGEVLVVHIDRFPETPDENPEGHVLEVVGAPGTPDVEVRKVLLVAGIEEDHPVEAVRDAESYGAEVDPKALEGREDLTHIPLPTIDPEDARDHDDAVWVERLDEGGYRVWVAIADVSAYVREGTALDAAARDRGCSLYLPDRSIPMLPRSLSSNLCSLLPDVLRLCLCAIIDLDATASVVSSRVVEGFMRSQAKLTYEGVARALKLTTVQGDKGNASPELRPGLALLREVAMLLRKRRMDRGALDFDLPETKILLDPTTRMPVDAVKRAKDPGVAKAYQIVEELMLLANEVVAEIMVERNEPTIFRVHAPPDPERIERFAGACDKLGIQLDVEDAQDPMKLAAFVRKIKGHPSQSLLDTLLVRSLKQAMYDVNNIGHFGLASDAYLHFTSPIRRYPDLVVHRTMRRLIRAAQAKKSGKSFAYGRSRAEEKKPVADEAMRSAALLSSERERRAMQAEREIGDIYCAFLMQDAVGDMFAGTVTGIVSSGVFVTLEEPNVSVLVKTELLGNDDYQADELGFSVTARRSGDRITLGDGMMVQIEDVSIERRTVYARRVSTSTSASEGKKPARRGSSEAPSPRGKGPSRKAKGKPSKRGGIPQSSERQGKQQKSAFGTAKPAKTKKAGKATKATKSTKKQGKKVSAGVPSSRRR